MVSLVSGPAVPFGCMVAVPVEALAREVWTARSLGEVFGPTQRQAAAVLQVLAGAGAAEARGVRPIGPETPKMHLERAFRRTDTRARLVARLLDHPEDRAGG